MPPHSYSIVKGHRETIKIACVILGCVGYYYIVIIYAFQCFTLSVQYVVIPECHKLLLKDVISQLKVPNLPGKSVVENMGTTQQERGQKLFQQPSSSIL